MTFLNWSMIFGLLALAIPILIHLLNRSKPKVMDWAAMQFLEASLTFRSRRILAEELILLMLRCLALACLALAMARPFLPALSRVPWFLVIPSFLATAVAGAMAAALWKQPTLRRRLLAVAAALALAGLAASAFEHWNQGNKWFAGSGSKDVAIVLDASMSMNVTTDGQTGFKRALDEAVAVLDACRPGDAFTIILAGPVPRTLVGKPTSDRHELRRLLQDRECHPLGGSMSVLEALNAASLALAEGTNPSKTILLFTDGQSTGWDTQSEVRWRFVTDNLKRFAVPPKVIVRRLPAPATFRNAAVVGLSLSREVVGTDRPFGVDVQVLNSGSAPAQPTAVELYADTTLVERQPFIKELLPHVTEVMHFSHQFTQPGRHILRAVVIADDDLKDDNTLAQVLDVPDTLPVMIVDGGSSGAGRAWRDSIFLTLALTPRSNQDTRVSDNEPLHSLLVAMPTNATDFLSIENLDAYRVVILANVSRLPAEATDRLAAFVKKGGGLLLAPGARAEAGYYNTWQNSAGERLSPALLGERVTPASPVHLDPRSFSHSALRLIADPRHSDIAAAQVSAYWKLGVDSRDPEVRACALLDQGDPWLVERRFGRGFILLTATALDRRDSTLPSLMAFLPLVQELTTYLAAPSGPDANLKPGAEYTQELRIPADFDRDLASNSITVMTPSGTRRPAQLSGAGPRQALRFGETGEPGLYQITLPPTVAQPLGGATNPVNQLAFTVVRQAEESTLTALSEVELATIHARLDSFLAPTRRDLLTALAGDVPGRELWQVLALCVLLILLAETALARWIAIKRRFHGTGPVSMKTPVQSQETLRGHLNRPHSSAAFFPIALPATTAASLAVLLGMLWVMSHRRSRTLGARWRWPAFALRCILGSATLIAAAKAAAHGVTFATNWPLWTILAGGAVLVEAVIALYRLERRILSRPKAILLSSLRVTLLLGVVAMLCQPVLVLETARHVQRHVAVVVDDTASMHIPDTGLTASEKLRLAESLGVLAAHRTFAFETCADRLRVIREQVKAQNELLASLAGAGPGTRTSRILSHNAEVRRALADAHRGCCAETNTFTEAAAKAVLQGDQALNSAVNTLSTHLTADICVPLKEATEAAGALAKGGDKTEALTDALMASLRRIVLQINEVASATDALAEKIDEGAYRTLPAPSRTAVDAAVAAPRSSLAKTMLIHPSRSPGTKSVSSLLERLDSQYGVRLYTFGDTLTETRLSSWTAAGTASNTPAMRTDLAGALTTLMTGLSADETAGVLLLTDGRHNAPSALEPVARSLGLQKIPVFPVVFGGARTPTADAAIAAAIAPETVNTNDRVSVDIDLKLDGLAGSNVVVQLLDGSRLVASNTVAATGDTVRRRIQLSDVPRTNGLHQYRAVIVPLTSEVLTNNNEALLPVMVGTEPIRVLLIDGRPRWEFRYLKNLFVNRDTTIRLQYVLLQPDRIAGMQPPPERAASVTNAPGEAEATALPATDAEWMKFDVIILGDVSPGDLGPRGLHAVRSFVLDRGGSLVVLSGPLNMPHAFMDTPLADILPVQCTPSDRPILTAPEAEFRIAPTAEGRESILLRLDDDPAQNAADWDSIPSVHWRHALKSTKEGASVLAYALPADPPDFLQLRRQGTVPGEETLSRRRQYERENALIVVQHVAPGNVLFIATDNTWRLRYRRGDLFHHRFWGQAMRWATSDRLASGTVYARLGTDRPRYPSGTPVHIRVRLMTADFSRIRQAPMTATVWSGDKMLLRRDLPPQPDAADLHTTNLGLFPEGSYRVELDVHNVPGLPDSGTAISTEFAVTPGIPTELVELSADRGLLTGLAGLTGGRTFEPQTIEKAVAALGPAVVTRRERRQIELWDNAWFFALLVAVATAEWILRKRERLP